MAIFLLVEERSAVVQYVEPLTPGDEVIGSIPAGPPASHWLGQCQYNVTG